MSDDVKYLLPENRSSKAWYNIAADLPKPLPPPLHPGTGRPIGPADLSAIFPMALIAQEVSAEREIEIPEPVREVYKLWRPAPLFRARRLERLLDTPARIFYKYEGVSPPGNIGRARSFSGIRARRSRPAAPGPRARRQAVN